MNELINYIAFCLNMTVFICHWMLGIKTIILFITGFHGPVNQEHLKAFFRQFGQIRKLTYDRQSKFAIVQFSERFVLKRTVYTDLLLGGIYLCLIISVDTVLLCFRQSAQMCLSKELYYRGHVLHVKQREIRAPPNQGKMM